MDQPLRFMYASSEIKSLLTVTLVEISFSSLDVQMKSNINIISQCALFSTKQETTYTFCLFGLY